MRELLESYEYAVSPELNGDIFQVLSTRLGVSLETATLQQFVMALNMARILKGGKAARFSVIQRTELAALHKDFPQSKTRKAQRETLSMLEKQLEEEHGKYASKANLLKTKFSTETSYTPEWMKQITGFAESLRPRITEVPVRPLSGEVEAFERNGERFAVDARGREWRTPPVKTALDIFLSK